ncbi:MAG: response regulator [Pseudomonadota bacterium]
MDWRMPVMDGLEATRRIRALDGGREVKIVALSASVFKDERDQVLAAGADDFEPKPVQLGRIYDCLARQLGVRYVDVAGAPATASARELDPGALAALPATLRTELETALVSLDRERIARVLTRVTEDNPALGAALEGHARQLKYTAMLQALQTCHREVATDEVPS